MLPGGHCNPPCLNGHHDRKTLQCAAGPNREATNRTPPATYLRRKSPRRHQVCSATPTAPAGAPRASTRTLRYVYIAPSGGDSLRPCRTFFPWARAPVSLAASDSLPLTRPAAEKKDPGVRCAPACPRGIARPPRLSAAPAPRGDGWRGPAPSRAPPSTRRTCKAAPPSGERRGGFYGDSRRGWIGGFVRLALQVVRRPRGRKGGCRLKPLALGGYESSRGGARTSTPSPTGGCECDCASDGPCAVVNPFVWA
jgi:hypothetical protein